MITFSSKGNFDNTDKFLKRIATSNYMSVFDKYGREGVALLSSATPIDSGKTSMSWKYGIKKTKSGVTLVWSNSNVVDGVPVAILIQYGHATKSGGYVKGRDYINPVIKPLFDKLIQDMWREVSKL